jgi:hypothetical protein
MLRFAGCYDTRFENSSRNETANTAQKYMRKRGPRGRIRAHFIDNENGKWITLQNLIVTLEAERKMLMARIAKLDKAVAVLRTLE